jgi:hypothetical protein
MKWLLLTVLVAIVAGSTAAAYVWGWRASEPSDRGQDTGGSTTPGRRVGTVATNAATPLDVKQRRISLPAETLRVRGAFLEIAAGNGRVMPLPMQPKICGTALVWNAVRDTRLRIQPWPGCRAEYERIPRQHGKWDSYRFEAAIAERLMAANATWRISGSCGYILNRLVLPDQTGETLGKFESLCFPDVMGNGFKANEKTVGNVVAAGASVYFNLFSARRHRSRRENLENPAVWRLSRRGAPARQPGWNGLLVDGHGDRLLVRKKSALVLASVRERLADGRVFAGARLDPGYWPLVAGLAVALTEDRVVIQRGDAVHVYDAATGATQATWPLQRDPFIAPDETETPPPTLLDPWGDLIVYVSGRRIRVLRLDDGYDAIILQRPFLEEGNGFPYLDAAVDETGLFYAASMLPDSDRTLPHGHGRVMFVTREALDASLP